MVAISVESGKVLDFEILFLYCHDFKMHEDDVIGPELYNRLSSNCQLHF